MSVLVLNRGRCQFLNFYKAKVYFSWLFALAYNVSDAYLIQVSLLLFGQQGFVISRNNKYKQLTLLSQGKLALTAINKLFHYKNIGAPKKLLNPASTLS
jgi:hypothetical protein